MFADPSGYRAIDVQLAEIDRQIADLRGYNDYYNDRIGNSTGELTDVQSKLQGYKTCLTKAQDDYEDAFWFWDKNAAKNRIDLLSELVDIYSGLENRWEDIIEGYESSIIYNEQEIKSLQNNKALILEQYNEKYNVDSNRPYMRQNDSRYADITYGAGYKIGATGCNPSSIATGFNYFGVSDALYTASQIIDTAGSNYIVKNGGISYRYLDSIPSDELAVYNKGLADDYDFVVSVTGYGADTDGYTAMIEHLNNADSKSQGFTIIQVDEDWRIPNSGHYMVALDYNPTTDEILWFDPNGTSNQPSWVSWDDESDNWNGTNNFYNVRLTEEYWQ